MPFLASHGIATIVIRLDARQRFFLTTDQAFLGDCNSIGNGGMGR